MPVGALHWKAFVGSMSRQTLNLMKLTLCNAFAGVQLRRPAEKTAMIRALFFPIHHLMGCYQHETIFRNDLRIDDGRVFVRLWL